MYASAISFTTFYICISAVLVTCVLVHTEDYSTFFPTAISGRFAFSLAEQLDLVHAGDTQATSPAPTLQGLSDIVVSIDGDEVVAAKPLEDDLMARAISQADVTAPLELGIDASPEGLAGDVEGHH